MPCGDGRHRRSRCHFLATLAQRDAKSVEKQKRTRIPDMLARRSDVSMTVFFCKTKTKTDTQQPREGEHNWTIPQCKPTTKQH